MKVVIEERQLKKLLEESGVPLIVDLKNADIRLESTTLVLHAYFKKYSVNIQIYDINPDDLLLNKNAILIPEDKDELAFLLPRYLRKVDSSVSDELLEFVEYWIAKAARWPPGKVKKYFEAMGIDFVTISIYTTDPCSSSLEPADDEIEKLMEGYTLWKWRKRREERWRYYGETEELALKYNNEINRLVFIYEHHSGDFNDAGGYTAVAVYPPLHWRIMLRKERSVCGPDGYVEEITKDIYL